MVISKKLTFITLGILALILMISLMMDQTI